MISILKIKSILIFFAISLSCWGVDFSKFDPEEGKKGQPYLYEIRHPELPASRHYILGTRHDVPIDLLHKVARYTMSKCDILIGEVDNKPREFASFSDFSLQELEEQGLIGDKFKAWVKYFPEEEKKFLDDKISQRVRDLWGISYERLHPGMIVEVLREWREGASYAANRGIDSVVASESRKAQRPYYGLENGKDRLLAYNFYGLREADFGCSTFILILIIRDIIKDCQSQAPMQTQQGKALTVEDFPDYFSGNLLADEVLNSGVINRNLLWIPRMKAYMGNHPKETIMFKVGFGHLNGEKGILNLLQAEGCNLVRINKKGHPDPSLHHLCNYTIDRTYLELLQDAAKKMIQDKGFNPLLGSTEEESKIKLEEAKSQGDDKLREKISIYLKIREASAKDYKFFVEKLTLLSNPQAQEKLLSPAEYDRVYKLSMLLREYPVEDYHTCLQIGDGDKELSPSYAMGTDLSYAIKLILNKARDSHSQFLRKACGDEDEYY